MKLGRTTESLRGTSQFESHSDFYIHNSQFSILNCLSVGRFTSIDPLMEEYPGWTPYQYSMNNPVNMLDGNGRDAEGAVYAKMSEQQINGMMAAYSNKYLWLGISVGAAVLTAGASFEAMILADGALAASTSTAGFMASTTSAIVNTMKIAAPDNKDVQNLQDNPLGVIGQITDQATSNTASTATNIGNLTWNIMSLGQNIVGFKNAINALDKSAHLSEAIVNVNGIITNEAVKTTVLKDKDNAHMIYPVYNGTNNIGNGYYPNYRTVQQSNYISSSPSFKPSGLL